MITFILVVAVISALILVHEAGHFYSARWLGVRVEEFGFGFPPRLYSRVKNGVRYSINLLPLGGFVKIFGENGEGGESPDSFVGRPIWQRFIILAAGVGMNLVLAWVFFSIGAGVGIPQMTDDANSAIPVSIVSVAPGSPAEVAGIHFGDAIVEMRWHDLKLRPETEKDVQDFVAAARGEEMSLTVKRGNETEEFTVTPRVSAPESEGSLGIGLGRLMISTIPWYMAPIEGAKILARSFLLTIQGLWMILSELVMHGGGVGTSVSGPVGVFMFAEETHALGLAYFLQFMGLLSVNLAILNFLPIPALDGGRVVFLLIEKVLGRRVKPEVENIFHMIGFVLLITLMAVVTYKDIVKIW